MSLLKDILGLSPDTFWEKFAKKIDATFVAGHYGDSDSAVVNYEKWTIILDNYTSRVVSGDRSYQQSYTRIRAPFIPKDDLKFKISRTGLLNSIGKLFGGQDIVIGDPAFDKAFIIKGNDEYKIQTLFSNIKLREMMASQDDIQIEIIDTEGTFGEKVSPGTCELYLLIDGVIRDMEQLKNLISLFQVMLDALDKIGSLKPIKVIN